MSPKYASRSGFFAIVVAGTTASTGGSLVALTVLVYRAVAFGIFDQGNHPFECFPLTFQVMWPSDCGSDV